jgi:hypothetical protein
LSSRPLRTSWLIVGMGGLDLLPALGRAVDVVRCCGVPGRPARPILAAPYRPAPAFGRVALCVNRPAGRAGLVAPRDSARPPHLAVGPVRDGSGPWSPAGPEDRRTPRCTANGSRPRTPWAQLTTVPGPVDRVKAGSTCGPRTGPAGLLGTNRGRRWAIPGRVPAARPWVLPGKLPETGGGEEDHARAVIGPIVPGSPARSAFTSLLSYPGPTVGAEPLTSRCSGRDHRTCSPGGTPCSPTPPVN